MKAYVKTIAAALIFIALAVYIFTSERGRVPEKEEVFGLQTQAAQKLDIQRPDEDPIVIERRGDRWYVAAPYEGLADQEEAETRVEAITRLKPKGTRSGVDLNSEEFGLTEPLLSATLQYGKGGANSVRVHFGKPTMVGSNRYARIDGRDDLYIIPNTAFTKLTKNADDLREKRVTQLDVNDVDSFTIQYDDTTISVQNRGTEDEDLWFLTEPIEARGSEFDIEQYVRDMSRIEAVEFFSESDETREWGFDKPWVTVAFNTADEKPTTLTFGSQYENTSAGTGETLIYVRSSNRDEIMSVDFSEVEDKRPEPIDLRDRSLVDMKRENINYVRVQSKKKLSFAMKRLPDGWTLDRPTVGLAKAAKADDIIWDIVQLEAAEYLEEEPKDLKEYGLAVPDTMMEVRALGTDEPLTLKFGYETDDGKYYCQTSESSQVYVVDRILLDDLPQKLEEIESGADNDDG